MFETEFLGSADKTYSASTTHSSLFIHSLNLSLVCV